VEGPQKARQVGGKRVSTGKKILKPGLSGRPTVINDPVSTVDHGENAENVVPALSVIKIQVSEISDLVG
jgi:hypothetical protein